jgi:hypothetical protein
LNGHQPGIEVNPQLGSASTVVLDVDLPDGDIRRSIGIFAVAALEAVKLPGAGVMGLGCANMREQRRYSGTVRRKGARKKETY